MLQYVCQQLVMSARAHALHGRQPLAMPVGRAFLQAHFFATRRDQFM
jgi:hypothetical protein